MVYRNAMVYRKVRTGLITGRRSVTLRLPSANKWTLASSQRPYSACSVRILRAVSLDVPRGK